MVDDRVFKQKFLVIYTQEFSNEKFEYITNRYLPQFEDIKCNYIRDLQDIDTTITKYYEKF